MTLHNDAKLKYGTRVITDIDYVTISLHTNKATVQKLLYLKRKMIFSKQWMTNLSPS